MADYTTRGGYVFEAITEPSAWTPTYQAQAAGFAENDSFLNEVKADFVRGASHADVGQEPDGGFLVEVTTYDTDAGKSGTVTLLEPSASYGGTNMGVSASALLYRRCTIYGIAMFIDAAADAMPGGSTDHTLCSNTSISDYEIISGTFYTGPGDDSAGSDDYNANGTPSGNLWRIYVDKNDNKLKLFWDTSAGNDATGIAFSLLLTFGTKCEQ